MAIAFDAASGRHTGTASSATLAHTCSGSDRVLVVSIKVAAGNTVSGVTYAGVAMTQLVTGTTPTVATRAYMFILVAPALGTNNIVATFSGSNAFGMSGASYTRARQTQPDAAAVTVSENATGSRTASVTVVEPGSWLVGGALVTEDQSVTGIVNGILRTSVAQSDIIDSNGGLSPGAQTIGYTWALTDRHVFFAFSLAPAPELTGGSPMFFGGGVTIG